MNLVSRAFLLLWSIIFLEQAHADESFNFSRQEIPWGEALTLNLPNSPRVEVKIRSRQVSYVSVEVADYSRMRSVWVDKDRYGNGNWVELPTTEHKRVDRKNGRPTPGGRGDMYLLYIHRPTGTHVYFSDDVAGQNRDALVIGTPTGIDPDANRSTKRPPVREPEIYPKTTAPRKAPKSDGYLSDSLLDWYLRLEKKREKLDMNDPEAVRLYNEEAARYQAEVKRAREASANLK